MVELVVSDLMAKAVNSRAYMLVLQEKHGLRKIVVALGPLEAQAIAFAYHKIDIARPLAHDLFGSLTNAFNIELDHIFIDRIVDGTFYSLLHYRREDDIALIDSRTSDAIAIALRANVPIVIDNDLLNRMCIRDEQNGAISIPITAADEATLRTELDKAVKAENYELAMKLKEEIESRHQKESDEMEDTKENNE